MNDEIKLETTGPCTIWLQVKKSPAQIAHASEYERKRQCRQSRLRLSYFGSFYLGMSYHPLAPQKQGTKLLPYNAEREKAESRGPSDWSARRANADEELYLFGAIHLSPSRIFALEFKLPPVILRYRFFHLSRNEEKRAQTFLFSSLEFRQKQ